MKLGHWQKIQKLHIHVYPFYTMGSKLSLFLLDGQRFPRYKIFKIAIFGYETWPLAKAPEVAYTFLLPQVVKIELIFALQAAVSEIWADFQTCHIWAWNLAIVAEVAHILPKQLRSPKNFTPFCSTIARFPSTTGNQRNPHAIKLLDKTFLTKQKTQWMTNPIIFYL